MINTRAIANPFGISVFGYAQKRVEPDHVSVVFALNRLEKTPAAAFQAVKKSSSEIQAYLTKNRITEYGQSQPYLEQLKERRNKTREFLGYIAKVRFNMVIRDLSKLEDTLAAIVELGADEIESVSFGTDKIRTLRQSIREQAVREATTKAEAYCKAANVKLGKIVHIEDVNPDELERANILETPNANQITEQDDTENAFNPASTVVKAAVLLGFDLIRYL